MLNITKSKPLNLINRLLLFTTVLLVTTSVQAEDAKDQSNIVEWNLPKSKLALQGYDPVA